MRELEKPDEGDQHEHGRKGRASGEYVAVDRRETAGAGPLRQRAQARESRVAALAKVEARRDVRARVLRDLLALQARVTLARRGQPLSVLL
jgi:hypothetical protein